MPFKDPKKKAEYNAANSLGRRFRLRDMIRKLKELPCSDCGKTYPYYVMHFDHVSGVKTATVSHLAAARSEQRLIEELAKCELVCANCHAERTYGGSRPRPDPRHKKRMLPKTKT